MEKINMSYFIKHMDFFLEEARKNKIFVYPTDTVYGIGAIANEENIKRISDIKGRNSKPFSVIAPNIERIKNNFIVKKNFNEYINNLLRNYNGFTIILKKKNKNILKGLGKSDGTLGVRLIDHNFQEFVRKLGEPFITTSANISGTETIKHINDLSEELEENVDYAFDGGLLDNPPSYLIDYENNSLIPRG